jgi:hypothetical protein
MLLALLVTLVRKLSEWLSTDALAVRVVFVSPADTVGVAPLAPEWELLRALLPEAITNGLLQMQAVAPEDVARLCAELARRSTVHGLLVAAGPPMLKVRDASFTRLHIAGARPALADSDGPAVLAEGDEPVDSWGAALEHILLRWI